MGSQRVQDRDDMGWCDNSPNTDVNMEYRDYQLEIIKQGTEIIRRSSLLYLAMEVRTGKTLTSLGICDNLKAKDVLFVTKKKAIESIRSDYASRSHPFTLEVINYESLHKLAPDIYYDVIICDEAHCMGAFAKPSKRAKQVRDLVRRHPCCLILLSGTPTPESFSQMYHQVYGHPSNPFSTYKNFYRWADDYVEVVQRNINGLRINDYSDGKEEKILGAMEPYMINYTQKEAGFESQIQEGVMLVKMHSDTYRMCDRLKRDLVLQGSGDVILADTSVKLMSKLHQMYSGTVLLESGTPFVLDHSKGNFIDMKFAGKKIALFYKFKAELKLLKEVFKDRLTTDLEEFKNDKDKNIALQIVSGREGISLQEADYIVYFNIDFSATSYWQSRDRMTTKTRSNNQVYWVFSRGGIEEKIYRRVIKKKNYTLKHFKEDLLTLF